MEFYKTGKNKPTMAGWDITHGEVEQDYTLKFLPSRLPGRDGPPGADYVTLPALMPLKKRMISSYRPRDFSKEKEKIEALFNKGEFAIKPEGLVAYKRDFLNDFNKLNQSN